MIATNETETRTLAMETESLLQIVLSALDSLKAKDVTIIDVRGKTSITDIMVIASGTSDRHVKAMAEHLTFAAKQAGVTPLGVEGAQFGDWVLVDLNDVVVHVMLPRVRDFYNLEKLWDVDDSAGA